MSADRNSVRGPAQVRHQPEALPGEVASMFARVPKAAREDGKSWEANLFEEHETDNLRREEAEWRRREGRKEEGRAKEKLIDIEESEKEEEKGEEKEGRDRERGSSGCSRRQCCHQEDGSKETPRKPLQGNRL